MRSLKRLSVWTDKRGDTIIEVLIAIGIVSFVLTSAYAVTNRNTQASQKIQEQGQAQKLVERQIELLRSYSGPITGGSCLDIPDVTTGVVVQTTGPPCDKTADGSGAIYALKITQAAGTYKVSASWDALGGQTGNVTMYYRR